MIRRQFEHSLHLPAFGIGPNEPGIATRTQCQGQGVKQDRLARPRLTGQHGHAGVQFQVQPFNQHNVANRKARQHGDEPCVPLRQAGLPPARIAVVSTSGRETKMGQEARPVKPSNARLIQEPAFSCGSRPPDCRRLNERPYHSESGKLCPSTAAAVWASGTTPMDM